MDTQAALRLLRTHAPCQHDSVGSSLGGGQIWVSCQDCGQTMRKTALPALRQAATEYHTALAVLEAALVRKELPEREAQAGQVVFLHPAAAAENSIRLN